MIYLTSPYVVPLGTRIRNAAYTMRLCWCARAQVEVHLVAARKGLTRSCGHPDCGAL